MAKAIAFVAATLRLTDCAVRYGEIRLRLQGTVSPDRISER